MTLNLTNPSQRAFMHACGQLWDTTRALATRYTLDHPTDIDTCSLAPTWDQLPDLHQLRWATRLTPTLLHLHDTMHTTLAELTTPPPGPPAGPSPAKGDDGA